MVAERHCCIELFFRFNLTVYTIFGNRFLTSFDGLQRYRWYVLTHS
jgi:hypothetical protein